MRRTCNGDDPVSAKLLSKTSFFNRPRRLDDKPARQLVGLLRQRRIDGGNVQDPNEFIVDTKDGRSRAATPDVPGTKMLRLMNRYGAAFHDAGSGSVGSFRLLRPKTADHIAPVVEARRGRLFDAMVDYDALLITQQDDVAGRAGYSKKLIEVLACREDNSFGSFPVKP